MGMGQVEKIQLSSTYTPTKREKENPCMPFYMPLHILYSYIYMESIDNFIFMAKITGSTLKVLASHGKIVNYYFKSSEFILE